MKKSIVGLGFLLSLAFFLPSTFAGATATVTPATHKALYKMSMVSSQSSSVVDVSGQMYYEFTDTCDAWSTSQKFILNYVYADEPEAKFDSQYSSTEGKDDNSYNFAVRRLRNGEAEEEYVGSATRKPDDTGSATYTAPEKKDMDLPKGFLFPTAHTLKVISEAKSGAHIFNAQMFDGSDGEGALEVNVVIGDVIKPAVDSKLADNALLQAPARKVRMAFYPPATKKDEQTGAEPDYEMTLIMHENGVVSSMQIDYDQFSIKGDLQAIEAAPPPKC